MNVYDLHTYDIRTVVDFGHFDGRLGWADFFEIRMYS